ncbi:hypothetical protein KY285_012872 [Solanum tuberosum]|nr:hypothetical protein KY285_012872 [Solanum tuberosum]
MKATLAAFIIPPGRDYGHCGGMRQEALEMARQNDEHLPFIRFLDVASRDRHHDNRNTRFCCERGFVLYKLEEKEPAFYARLVEFGCTLYLGEFYTILPTVRLDDPHPVICVRGVNIPLNSTTINEALEVPEVPNHEYEARLREMYLEWLRDTLVEPTRRDQVYWGAAEGITRTYWSPDA